MYIFPSMQARRRYRLVVKHGNGKSTHAQTLHTEYVPTFAPKSGPNVGKYSIYGATGMEALNGKINYQIPSGNLT